MTETILDVSKTSYASFSKEDWVMKWIEWYGGISGSHHKEWLIDQIVRILKGTPVAITLVKFDNGQLEERFDLGDPTNEYLEWVKEMCDGEDGPDTYEWSDGIAP